MENKKWNYVLLEWVNCLKLCKYINDVEELRNGEFFMNLQKLITKSRDTQPDVLTFIFDLFANHYPNYIVDNKAEIHLSDLPEIDLKAVTSLLMHYTCIYDRRDVLTSPLCHSLSQSTQLIIRNFLQKISKDVTNRIMNDIIKSCIDDASDHLSGQWFSMETSSAKNSPLQDLLKTPVSKFGRFQEKDKTISRLKSDLESERFEKADLQEELKLQLEKNKKIEQQLLQKSNEISRLRGEVVALENRTPPHYQDMDSRELQRRLRSEIQSLEQYIKQLENEQEDIRKEKDTTKEQLRKTELQSNIWEEKFFETEHSLENLGRHAKKQEEELKALQMHCSELSSLLEEYRSKPANDSSLFDTFSGIENAEMMTLNETSSCCEDLACSVVEVQLRDAQKQNEELRTQIGQVEQVASQLEAVVVEFELKLKKSDEFNDKLTKQVQSLELDKEAGQKLLNELENQLEEAKKKITDRDVEIENLLKRLCENTESLHTERLNNEELHSKVQLLQSRNDGVEKRLTETLTKWKEDKERLQDSENAVAEIRALSEKLQFELADAILDNQKINDRFVDLTGKYENLIIKLQKTETSRTDLETQLSDVEILSNKLRTELVTFQHENDRLKEELDNEKMHAMKLDEERAVLLFKIQESKEKLDSLEKNNEKLSFEIETTRKQLTEALACLESNRNNSENLVLAQRTLEKELDEARSYTERLTIMLKECQIEKKDVSGKLDQSSKHVLTLEKEISILRSRLEESNELRDNLMKKNEALTLHNETVQKQLLDAIDLLEVSKKQTETLQTTQILLERQLHEVQSFSETQSMELEQLRHEKQSMKIAFEDTQSNLIIMTAKCSTLEEQKDISLLQIENLEKDLCNLQNDLKLKIQDANELKQTKIELETLLHEAQSNSEILKVEIRELELKNGRINNELNESTKTCKKLGEDKKLLSSKLEGFAEKCRNIEEKFAAEEEHLQNKLLKIIDSLESNKIELEQAQTARMNLATRLAEAEGLKATLKDELDEIKFKNNEISKELNKAHENLLTLQKEKRVLLEEVGTLKEENEKVVIENVTLCERMSEISIDLTSEKAECKKLKETVCALEASLKEVNASSEFVKCELGTVQHQLEESQKKCEELKAEKVSLEKQVEELRTVQDVVQNNLNEAEKCSRTLRSEVENLYGENCNMKDTLKQTRQYSKNLEKQKESLTVQLKDCETTKQELQVELDDLQKEISKVKSNLGEHKRVQESLEKKLVESDAFIENIQEEKHKISEILTHVKNENAILISKMEASNEKCTNLIRESSAIAASLELCRKELEESKEFRAGLETVLEKLTTERDKLAFERQQEIARLNESEKCRQELNNEKEILTSKLSTLENDNDELLSQIDILQRRIQELNDVAIKRELESQKSEETLTELLKEKRELSDNVDVLSNKNEELLCQNNDFQNQLSEAARNCKELTNVFNSEKEILTSKLIHLEGKSSTLENDNDKLLSQIDILQKQILDLKDVAIKRDLESQKNEETLTELLKEKRELLDKVDTLLKKNEELLCQNDYFQKQLVTVEGYYKELTNVKNTLDEQLHEMSNLSETLKVESEELRLQYQKSKTELDNSRDTLLKLTNEKENLAVMLKDAKEMNDELQKEILQVTNNLESNEQRRSDLEKQQVKVIRTLEQTKSENKKLLQRITEVEKTSSENRAVLEEEVNSLTSMTVKYKDELESTLKRMEESEQSLRDVQQQILTLDVKLKEVNEEKYVLEKKIELEEILSSESNEKIKSLEETVQDYEITISGLKNVVDSNLERLEALKEKLLFKKNEEFYAKKAITDLLQDYNIIWDEGEEKDLKMFISENVRKILAAKIQEGEKQRTELENEIEELKIKSTTAINLNASFQDMIEKLQTLVMDQSEVDSMDALKSNFDKVHSKINAIFQIKQKLSDDLCRSEERNVELIGQLENIKLEKKKLDESKTCLERNLAEEKEKTANLRKELEQKSKPNRPEKENILGVSTKVNKTREEELKKENMVLKRKLVLTENAKNNLEKVLKELREKNKTQETSSSPTSDALYKKLLQEYIQVKEENECIQKENDAKYQELLRDNEQLKLKTIQIKSEDDKKIIQDLQNVREAYGNVMSINSKLELEVVTLRKVIEEQNSEVVNLAHIKEAYERLLEENNKISTDIDTMKYKRMRDKEEFVRLLKKEREETVNREMKKIQEIRTEYEGKLEKMKEKMLKLYREEVNKKVKSVKDGQGETANILKTVANLREELFEADQKIQLLEMEKEILKANKKLESETKTFQLQTIASVTTVARNEEKAATLPRPSVTEEITISRRTSVGGLPNNIDTHNLQMEDEEDLFNDKYLSDLKEGKCLLPTDRECTTNRFSELAWRNSMVPPHLKSSYPAEMQFISPNRFKDEDIKTGNVEFEDSMCKLLPGEKPRKKDFGTTSYKRPGPPTPSKNGGRLSLQGNEVHPMREHCEAKTPKKIYPKQNQSTVHRSQQ